MKIMIYFNALFPHIRFCCLFLLLLATALAPGQAEAAAKKTNQTVPQTVPQTANEVVLAARHLKSVGDGEPFLLSVEARFPVELLEGDLQALWLGKKVPLPLARHTAQGYSVFECLLAVPLDCKEASLPLKLMRGKDELYSATILVEKRTYPSQPLTVAQKYVTPDPSLTERIQKEQKKNREILTRISPERRWSLPLARPVKGIITSEFGFRRILNGQPRSPHRGVDFRGAEGTPILACAAGKVVLAEEQYYSGNFVIIDHGLGVFSSYSHLSEYKCKVGDQVKAGQVIGLVGKTGRVTGPHLHFGFNVLGQAVSPEPIMTNFRP